MAKVRAKRAPRPPKVKVPKAVEVIEPEEDFEEPVAQEFILSNDNILQHLLNHRVRQRVQREQLYKSFVSQF